MFLDRTPPSTRLIFATARDDYAHLPRARRALDAQLRRSLPARRRRGRIGGSAERGRVLIESVVSSQAISVAASLLMSWSDPGLRLRPLGTSLRCILAIVWALALVLGVAGWAGLPLGVASSCFLALGVGVGLDYSIHLAFRAREEGEDEGSRLPPRPGQRLRRRHRPLRPPALGQPDGRPAGPADRPQHGRIELDGDVVFGRTRAE